MSEVIEVQLGGRAFAYRCPFEVSKGDRVMVPTFFSNEQVGTVVGHGSSYTGPMKSVVQVIERV